MIDQYPITTVSHTTVVSGTAQAMVIATGANTWFGQLAGRVSEQESEPNAFQQGISRVSMLLIRFMLVMAPVVLLINGYTKGDWWEAALFARKRWSASVT